MVRMKSGLSIAAITCNALSIIRHANAMVMLGGRRSRYFAVEQTLPPLSRHMPTFENQTETLPYSSSRGKALPVVYTNNPSVIGDWLSNNIPSSNGILGFDMESVPCAPWVQKRASFEGPATVQLATTESCLVVHLTRRNGKPSTACGPILEAVLGDETIVKAGAGIDQDMLELWECWRGLEARSRLDIGGIGSDSQGSIGLQRLTSSILGLDLGKTKKQALSDWSQVPLTDEQLIYSARDAWAGAAIVAELADADPDTFGTPALIDLLKSERSMEELANLVQSRKRAKAKIASIVKPYAPSSARKSRPMTIPVRKRPMPPKLQEKVSQLRQVVSQTTLGAPMSFDIEHLGFTIHPK